MVGAQIFESNGEYHAEKFWTEHFALFLYINFLFFLLFVFGNPVFSFNYPLLKGKRRLPERVPFDIDQ